MKFRSAVRWVIAADREQVVITECRRCGTEVDRGADRCPECGSTELGRYRFRSRRRRLRRKLAVIGLVLLLSAAAVAGLGVAIAASLGL